MENGDGSLEARTRDLALHLASDSSWLWFSGFLGALLKWLFGAIILSPYLWSSRHYVARFDPDQDLGLFRPKQHRPHCKAYSNQPRDKIMLNNPALIKSSQDILSSQYQIKVPIIVEALLAEASCDGVESHLSDFSNLRIWRIVRSQLGTSPVLQNSEELWVHN